MKIWIVLPLTLLCCAISTGKGFAQSFPTCATSNSDSDGDGYGYENGQSCLAPNTQAQLGQCIDTDGDGYGWNGVTTCEPLDGTVLNEQSVSGSFETALRAHIAGRWVCNTSFMEPQIFESQALQNGFLDNGCEANPSRRGLTYSTCNIRWVLGGLNETRVNLEDQTATYQTQKSTIQFDFSGVYQSFGHSFVPGGTLVDENPSETGSWNLTNSGYQFWLNGEAQHRLAFEVVDGTELFSYYRKDESRITCERE